MRTIISSWDPTGVDAEYAKAVDELLDNSARVIYEHSALGRDGHPANKIQLAEYDVPDSSREDRWAVIYTDDSSREVEESSTFDEADAYYDKLVSELGQSDVEHD
ncbi:hypothetical protein [Streptomyces sp. RKAG337]|uniref:hypothetical protein n=1 Tax=Streptomyces sp. RKAG337 TaxID=2893404 RepID=UPI0020340026|nr:hypothetical protein [Streptomyces sp. RKAG337]MCM2430990.1 hypothetical protein [Streptomyces sp. RKAG337]